MNHINWGDIATWTGAIGSIVSIFFVRWQVNKQVGEEKNQAYREARPYFTLKYKESDGISNPISSKDPIHFATINERLNAKFDYDSGVREVFQYLHIKNISKRLMMLIQITVHWEDGSENKIFQIEKIDTTEFYQLYLGRKGCIDTIAYVDVCYITELRERIKLRFDFDSNYLKYCHDKSIITKGEQDSISDYDTDNFVENMN